MVSLHQLSSNTRGLCCLLMDLNSYSTLIDVVRKRKNEFKNLLKGIRPSMMKFEGKVNGKSFKKERHFYV